MNAPSQIACAGRMAVPNHAPPWSIRACIGTPAVAGACLAGLLLAGWGARAEAVSLVVQSGGTSLWADQATEFPAEKLLRYVPQGRQATNTLPLADVIIVIPAVERGRVYKESEIADALARVELGRAKAPRLMKQLTMLQNEWESLRVVDGAMAAEIRRLADVFEAGRKTWEDYNEVGMQLGMIKYKDAQGRFDRDMNEAMRRVQLGYYGIDMTAIEARLSGEPVAAAEYEKIRDQAVRVMQRKKMTPDDEKRLVAAVTALREVALAQALKAAKSHFDAVERFEDFAAGAAILDESLKRVAKTDGEKQRLTGLRDDARRQAIEKFQTIADKLFAGGATLEGYTRGRAMLAGLRRQVAETPEEREAQDARMAQMESATAARFKNLDFATGGFPLSKADLKARTASEAFCSTREIPGQKVEEACYIIPAGVLQAVPWGRACQVPATLVFREALIGKPELAVITMGEQDNGVGLAVAPLAALPIRNAHATASLHVNLPALAAARPFADADGSYALLFLALRRGEGPQAAWIPISAGCRIPVATE